MTSVSSSTSTTYAYQTAISKLDTDGDGIVSAEELAAAKPARKEQQGTAEAETESSSALDKFASGMMAMLLEMQKQAEATESDIDANANTGSGTASSTEQTIAELFSTMDTDGDGAITQSEFIDGQPGDISADDAATLYDAFDTEDTASDPPDLTDTLENMKTAIAAYLDNLAETSAAAQNPITV